MESVNDRKSRYLSEIKRILFARDLEGRYNTPKGLMILEGGKMRLRLDEGWKDFEDLDADRLMSLCFFFIDNQTIFAQYLEEEENGGDDEVTELEEQEEVYSGEDYLGRIGVVRQRDEETGEEVSRLLFVSADFTWTTLTCYVRGEESSQKLAKKDLEGIISALSKWRDKIA